MGEENIVDESASNLPSISELVNQITYLSQLTAVMTKTMIQEGLLVEEEFEGNKILRPKAIVVDASV